jgi:carbon storage regulator
LLVLSRKIGEQIVIGDQVVFTITAIDRARVRLGITAPRPVSIRRVELDATDSPAVQAPGAVHTPALSDR